MTTDLSALSREELLAPLSGGTCDAFLDATMAEIARRLRLDSDLAARLARAEARADQIKADYEDMLAGCREQFAVKAGRIAQAEARVAELESQLAANGKGGEAFGPGDRVRVKPGIWGHANCPGTVVSSEQVGGVWVKLDNQIGPIQYEGIDLARIPPEPAVPSERGLALQSIAADAVLKEVSRHREAGRLPPEPTKPVEPQRSPLQAILDDARRRATVGAPWPSSRPPVEPAAEGKGVRRYGGGAASDTLDAILAAPYSRGQQTVADLAEHLQSVLSGVAEIAAEMDEHVREPRPLTWEALDGYAAKLRRVCKP